MRDTSELRVVIVCSGYDEASHFKDPGLIARELQRSGYDVTCLVAQKGLAGVSHAAWRIELIPGLASTATSWADYPADVFLVYFVDARQREWVDAIRKNNPYARVILKCDSDGLIPTGKVTVRSRAAKYQRDLIWFREIASPPAMFLDPFWKAPLRIAAHITWLVAHARPADVQRIQNLRKYLESFDSIVIESTEALQNLLLNFPSVAEKTVVVPNGVLQRRSSLNDRNNKKVIAVGRFNDYGAKRPLLMCRVLCSFLATHPDWSADIIGPYDAKLERAVHRLRHHIQTRL